MTRPQASKTTIVRFLIDFKKALARGNWEIVQRRVEYAQITEMTPTAIKLVLMTLTPMDYVAGPELNRDRRGSICGNSISRTNRGSHCT